MSNQDKPKVLVLIGPTASGKSDLAVRLAKKFNGEVVSADSRQVYRGLDIGTGKITKKEMRGVRHHLLDVANPKSQFSAEKYRRLSERVVRDIMKRGKLPIICGGTGYYIDGLVGDIGFPAVKADLKLRKRLANKSPRELLAILKKLDQTRFRAINANPSDKKNARRIVRAIEIAHTRSAMSNREALIDTTGKTNGRTREGRQNAKTIRPATFGTSLKSATMPALRYHKYDPVYIGIQPSRTELKKRIRIRLKTRLKHGMIAEAKRLHEPRSDKNPNGGLSWKRMEELGLEYRYLSRYLRGLITREELQRQLNTAIWQYAKRQMTWWRRNDRIRWIKNGDNIAVAAGRLWKSASY